MIALEFDFPKICGTRSLQSHRSFITTSGQEPFEHSREFLPFGPQPCRLNDCAQRILRQIIGSFSNDDGNGNEDVKKAIGLLRKTTTLHVHHAFLYISSPSLHDYDVKMPNCKFYGGRKRATTNFFFPL